MWQTHNMLGRSIYLTEYKKSGILPSVQGTGGSLPVFISLHISEEYSPSYAEEMKKLCRKLTEDDAKILADVSGETLDTFKVKDYKELKELLGLWGVRVDDGIGIDGIIDISKIMPIAINASTLSEKDARRIVSEAGNDVFAMHNFYPRPETGLDDEYFGSVNDKLKALGIRIIAFVPGDGDLRGPIYAGLPTLEKHRHASPYVSYMEMLLDFGVDIVFCGDPGLSEKESSLMTDFSKNGIISIPARLEVGYEYLYEKVFTNRVDSPAALIRFAESRSYAADNSRGLISPGKIRERNRGSVTIDNEKYLRYEGEIQILRKDFSEDRRVNVIGQTEDHYLPIIDLVERGGKFKLIKPKE